MGEHPSQPWWKLLSFIGQYVTITFGDSDEDLLTL